MDKKIMVVDDDPDILITIRRIFENEGFEVICTTSPQEGLRHVSDSAFDVILCDWKLPDFDGMDVVEELDRRSPDSAVVMISGYPAVERATEAMKRGAMDYLPKPFRPEEVIEAVKRAQERKLTEEKKTLGRFERIIKSWNFPLPPDEDGRCGRHLYTFDSSPPLLASVPNGPRG